MPYVLIRHKVTDYDSWRPVFDDHGRAREAAGSTGGQVFQNAEDLTEVVVLLEWDSVEDARRFIHSKDLREAMTRSGVTDTPDMFVLEKVEDTSA